MGRCYLGLDEQKGLVDLELLIARKDGDVPGAGSCASRKGRSRPPACLTPRVLELLEHSIE